MVANVRPAVIERARQLGRQRRLAYMLAMPADGYLPLVAGLLLTGTANAQLTATNLPIVIITTNTAIGNNQIDGNIKIVDKKIDQVKV